MASLNDVALAARVSVATASRALSGRGYVSAEARRQVVAAAAQVGYRTGEPAAETRQAVTVIAPQLERWSTQAAVRGIASALAAAGHDLVLHLAGQHEQRALIEQLVLRERQDAVILVDCAPTDHERSLLMTGGRCVAVVGRQVSGVPSLSIDHREAGRLATDHLLSLGHTRVAFLGIPAANDEAPLALRQAGFQQALRGGSLNRASVVVASDPSIPSGYSAALSLLADPRTRPAAVVAANDELAIGVTIAARQLGIAVPESLSVIGIDGHELTATFSLTTVTIDSAGLSAAAVERVLTGETGLTKAQLGTRLTVRASTRSPQARSA